jgi:hypothetical protein
MTVQRTLKFVSFLFALRVIRPGKGRIYSLSWIENGGMVSALLREALNVLSDTLNCI